MSDERPRLAAWDGETMRPVSYDDARKAVRLRRAMRFALRCLDDAEIVSPEARRFVAEARQVMRRALDAVDV